MDARQRFEALAAEVAGPIRRYALRRTDPDTADDVVAETLLVAWRRLDDIPPDAHLPWCYAVAANALANLHRSSRRQRSLVDRIVQLDPPREKAPELEPPDPELHEALAALRDGDRELLRLWAWEELAPAEIAVVLGMTPNAVSIRLHRAKKKLADELTRRKADASARHRPTERGGAR